METIEGGKKDMSLLTADTRLMRKPSIPFAFIEDIQILPSTELVPDEYEHENNEKGLALIFYSNFDKNNMQCLKRALNNQGFQVSEKNVFHLSTKEYVSGVLKKIAEEDHTEKTCLIVAFVGSSEEDKFFLDDEKNRKLNYILLKDVCSQFTADKCPSLKNKPKIFIFQGTKWFDLVQHDGKLLRAALVPEGAYDIPAEADILVIYKRVEDLTLREHFVEELCYKFEVLAEKEDVIGIVTETEHDDSSRPLLISTLTRKFYLSPSNRNKGRGHHLDIYHNYTKILERVKELGRLMDSLPSHSRAIAQKTIKKWRETSPGDGKTRTDSPASGDGFMSKMGSPKSVAADVVDSSGKKAAGKKSVPGSPGLKKGVTKPKAPWKP